jgi:hypothetical protein
MHTVAVCSDILQQQEGQLPLLIRLRQSTLQLLWGRMAGRTAAKLFRAKPGWRRRNFGLMPRSDSAELAEVLLPGVPLNSGFSREVALKYLS